MSSPNNDLDRLVAGVIEEVVERLNEAYLTSQFEWEPVAKWEPASKLGETTKQPRWRVLEAEVVFYTNRPLPETICEDIKNMCEKDPNLAHVHSVTIEGRKVTVVFSPSKP